MYVSLHNIQTLLCQQTTSWLLTSCTSKLAADELQCSAHSISIHRRWCHQAMLSFGLYCACPAKPRPWTDGFWVQVKAGLLQPGQNCTLSLLKKLPWTQLPTRHSGSKHPTEPRSKRSDRQRSSRCRRSCATETLHPLRTHDTATGIPYLQQLRWAAALSSQNVLSLPDKWKSWSESQHGGVCSLT